MEETWTAFVAAYGHEEALKYLETTIGRKVRINTSGSECRLDTISDEVRKVIVKNTVGTKDQEEIKKVNEKKDKLKEKINKVK